MEKVTDLNEWKQKRQEAKDLETDRKRYEYYMVFFTDDDFTTTMNQVKKDLGLED